eukprot:2200525-Rhodomonas_salina.1
MGGDGEGTRDEAYRANIFASAAGMNPDLQWDEWFSEDPEHDFNSAIREQILKEEQCAMLLTSFEARVMSETADEEDEQWSKMKRKWCGREGIPHQGKMTMTQIFDRIEAELHGRRRLDDSDGTHWDQDLEFQISEVLGQPLGDPNQLHWMQSGMPVVDLQR